MNVSNTKLGKLAYRLLPKIIFFTLRDKIYTPIRFLLTYGNWRIFFDYQRRKIRKFVLENFDSEIQTTQIGNYCLPKSVLDNYLKNGKKINVFSLGLATNFKFDERIKSIFGDNVEIFGFDPSRYSCEKAIEKSIFSKVIQAGVVATKEESSRKMKLVNSKLVNLSEAKFNNVDDESNSNDLIRLIDANESLSLLNGEKLNILKIDIESNTINVIKSFLTYSNQPDLIVAEIENIVFGTQSKRNYNYISEINNFLNYLRAAGYSNISTIKRDQFKFIGVELFAFKN